MTEAHWEWIFKAFCTAQVWFLIGMILVVIAEYLPYALAHKLRKKHVLLISLSYCILLLLTLRGVYIGAFFHPYDLHELAVISLISAYAISDAAMLTIFDYVRKVRSIPNGKTVE